MHYSLLPIFQKSYDLFIKIYQETHNFSREYKYSLGLRMKEIAEDLLDGIILANSQAVKLKTLEEVSQNIEKMRIYIRLAKDLNVISLKKYEVLSKQIDEIGRMTGGWLKEQKAKTGQNPPPL